MRRRRSEKIRVALCRRGPKPRCRAPRAVSPGFAMGETGMCWTTAGPARGWLAGREPRARDFDGWKARDDEVGAAAAAITRHIAYPFLTPPFHSSSSCFLLDLSAATLPSRNPRNLRPALDHAVAVSAFVPQCSASDGQPQMPKPAAPLPPPYAVPSI